MLGPYRSVIAATCTLATGLALALPMAASAQEAANARLLVPGGELDPSRRPLDVYIGTPVRAQADPATACRNVEEYGRRVNEGRYAEIAGLFTSDAVVLEPTQGIARGTAQITNFYVNYIGPMKPVIVQVAFVGNRTDCMVVNSSARMIDGEMRYMLASVNHFTLGDKGLFVRMTAFSRGQSARP